jgi:hypothetical protein
MESEEKVSTTKGMKKKKRHLEMEVERKSERR